MVASLRTHRLLLEPLVWVALGRMLLLPLLEAAGHELLLLLGKLQVESQAGGVRRQEVLRRFDRRTGVVRDEHDGCLLHRTFLPRVDCARFPGGNLP